jgi:hypothetical protein
LNATFTFPLASSSSSSHGHTMIIEWQAIYSLGQRLIDLQSSSLDEDNLRIMLLELKSSFFVTPSPAPRNRETT